MVAAVTCLDAHIPSKLIPAVFRYGRVGMRWVLHVAVRWIKLVSLALVLTQTASRLDAQDLRTVERAGDPPRMRHARRQPSRPRQPPAATSRSGPANPAPTRPAWIPRAFSWRSIIASKARRSNSRRTAPTLHFSPDPSPYAPASPCSSTRASLFTPRAIPSPTR